MNEVAVNDKSNAEQQIHMVFAFKIEKKTMKFDAISVFYVFLFAHSLGAIRNARPVLFESRMPSNRRN